MAKKSNKTKKPKATKLTIKIKGSVGGVRKALAKITQPVSDPFGRDFS